MKNYLIIGGSSGIGASIVDALTHDGHQVYATYHKHEIHSSDNVHYFKYDVTKDAFSDDVIPDNIHGLVYCPGSINLKPFARIKPEAFLEDYELQVVGAVKVIQAILPKLKGADNASIVLFTTVAVQQGFNFHSQVSASKGAIEGLTRALAAEFAPAIRVNAIAPSLTDTNLSAKLLNTTEKIEANAQRHPLKRVGKPSDISALATFLLSEKASWITGQVIGVDGGMSRIK